MLVYVADSKVSFEEYLVINSVADINAVNMYSIGNCRPKHGHPMHAYFEVE